MVPDKAFEKLHEILIKILDESLPILDSARTGVQMTWIGNQVKSTAAKKCLRILCLQNRDKNVLQNDYKAQCKVVRNLIN